MEKKMTFYPNLPTYAEGKYNAWFLLKFFPTKENRDYFLSGKLFMRQHTEFAMEELGKGRSDITEGADIAVIPHDNSTFPDIRFFEENGEVYIKIEEYLERPTDYRDNQLFISYPIENQRRNLFCMYTLWLNKETGEICILDAENMENFGEYGVIIADVRKFFNSIATATNNDSSIIDMTCGFVNYVERKNVMDIDPFTKPADDFAYQNEFRFCANTDNTNLLELDTHEDFHSIAIPIRRETFFNSATYANGQLRFAADINREKLT